MPIPPLVEGEGKAVIVVGLMMLPPEIVSVRRRAPLMTEQTCSFLPLPVQLGTAVSYTVPLPLVTDPFEDAENIVPGELDDAPNKVTKLVEPVVMII